MSSNIKTLFQVAEIEITYRNKQRHEDRPLLNSSQRVHEALRASWDENKIDLQEQFKILLLDTGCRALGISEIGRGGIDYTPVDIRIILATALKGRATRLVLAHNHPSGTPSPSKSDRDLTKKLAAAASLMDISVVDHIILTRDSYYSFADEGIMPVSTSNVLDLIPI